MNYGKIIDGILKRFDTIYFDNGGVICNPSHEMWLENGYFPIIENRPAEIEGFWISESFEMVGSEIVASYSFNAVEVSNGVN